MTFSHRPASAQQILEDAGAIIAGHFQLNSGGHSAVYVGKDILYVDPEKVWEMCLIMSRPFIGLEIEAVAAPAVAGTILSHDIARHLSALTGARVGSVYADKDGPDFVLRRGYDKVVKGRRVLVAEDVSTTGATVRKLIAETRRCGGIVMGVALMCNRAPEEITSISLDVPLMFNAVELPLETFSASQCPQCAAGVPLNTDHGHGGKQRT